MTLSKKGARVVEAAPYEAGMVPNDHRLRTKNLPRHRRYCAGFGGRGAASALEGSGGGLLCSAGERAVFAFA